METEKLKKIRVVQQMCADVIDMMIELQDYVNQMFYEQAVGQTEDQDGFESVYEQIEQQIEDEIEDNSYDGELEIQLEPTGVKEEELPVPLPPKSKKKGIMERIKSSTKKKVNASGQQQNKIQATINSLENDLKALKKSD